MVGSSLERLRYYVSGTASLQRFTRDALSETPYLRRNSATWSIRPGLQAFHGTNGKTEVRPGFGLVLQGAQKVSRVVGDDQGRAAIKMHLPAHAGDAGIACQ